ncbi:hypothetical protein AB0O07_29805 [Streptomyces sp. NPDC093085]|uniref:hypothetical protein n=1 Tax=Streptomyces sp. NPDC093085 TaxID=3155068 RepID=UPI0034335CD8
MGAFWADIEKHHPGIDTLDLPTEVAETGKERIRFTTREGKAPIPRQTRTAVLTGVRALYLDIQQWALEDPGWAAWAVPSPVRESDTGGFTKVKKKVRAKMRQRVRERLPRLPEPVNTTETRHSTQKKLLAAAQVTAVGEIFDHEGRRYRRISRRGVRPKTRFQHRPEMVLIEDMAGGLPVHIAARLLGHTRTSTTEAYLAVFQEDLIRSYRAFLDQRRATRPAAEYREPATDEWRGFREHFHTRKLELGDCARP